ncbi:hypothetical protein RH831_05450 [Halodesulfurarchaeum sp. HSR-GB]|uniref:EMC6-like membrane protein n=1 Tax=Halodesulfurarchaeum sp. HSR-GB TaxID=3074077 RepID=UPI00285538F4|nr:hypothetical protein [Halodesulfurarchaeum sp. HSR-GB]MDR5656623.1 hypothetical protein [Halodesulfurarchaeum sp. HSR-GB]
MSTEKAGMTGHLRSVVITTETALGGVLAGVASAALATSATDQLGLAIMVGALIANIGVLRLLGIDVSEFGAKDHLFNAFMTFSLWFVTWGVFLTTGVTL